MLSIYQDNVTLQTFADHESATIEKAFIKSGNLKDLEPWAWQENEKGAGLRLFAIPDPKNEKNDYEISIPKLSSLILTHSLDGEVKGLKNWSKEERPPVSAVFYFFRIIIVLFITYSKFETQTQPSFYATS